VRRAPIYLFAGLALGAAADRPSWTVDLRALDGREFRGQRSVGFQFTSSGEIMLSFLSGGAAYDTHGNALAGTPGSYVVMLIDRADGHLVRKAEWPSGTRRNVRELLDHGPRIQPLPDGGYVCLIDGQLLALDASLKVVNERCVVCQDEGTDRYYELIPARSGPLFLLDYSKFLDNSNHYHAEVIDSRSLATLETWDFTGTHLEDLWGQRVLAVRLATRPRTPFPVALPVPDPPDDIIERQIGGPWRDLGLKLASGRKPRFTADGSIVGDGRREGVGACWAIMAGPKGDRAPVCYSPEQAIVSITPARRAPVIAVLLARQSAIRSFLDLTRDSWNWVVVHESDTGRKLVTTPKRFDLEAYALSSDGQTLAVLTEKKLEAYAVRTSNDVRK